MIIHISSERLQRIKDQGYKLPISRAITHIAEYKAGDNEIHELNNEYDFCARCDGEFNSIEASTPTEYEVAKELLRRKGH